jgi:hypothetical protein
MLCQPANDCSLSFEYYGDECPPVQKPVHKASSSAEDPEDWSEAGRG